MLKGITKCCDDFERLKNIKYKYKFDLRFISVISNHSFYLEITAFFLV